MARGLPTTADYERMAAEWFPVSVYRHQCEPGEYAGIVRRLRAALANAAAALHPSHAEVHIGYARLFAAACRQRVAVARAASNTTSPEGR